MIRVFSIAWLTAATVNSSDGFSPIQSSFVAPFIRPQRFSTRAAALSTLSDENEAKSPKQSMDVRKIMQLLEESYPAPCSDNNSDSKQIWGRTRNYLYRYRANLAKISSSKTEGDIIKRKRAIRNRGPLTIKHIQQIMTFLESTFPNRPELQACIIQSTPRILSQHHSIESRLMPTVELLKGLYGDMPGSDGKKGTMFFEAIQRNPKLLLVQGVGYAGVSATEQKDTSSIDYTVEVEDFLLNVVGVSSSGISKLKKNQPTLFQLSLQKKVQPAVEYLSSLLLGRKSSIESAPLKQKKLLAKIVTNHPNLLQLDVESNLKSTAHFLRDYFELTDSELASVIGSNPSMLGLAVDCNLRPKIQLLAKALANGMNKENSDDESEILKSSLRKSILKHPQMLSLSTNNICAKIDYFDSIDVKSSNGESATSLAARLLVLAPSVYSLSLSENIMPKVDYLAALWGWSSLSSKLCECPLLTLSMDNIQQTLSFYNMTGYIDLPNEDGQVSASPKAGNVRSRYIATSLYNRLLPRWNFLLKEQERKEDLLEELSLDNEDTRREDTTKYYLPSPNTSNDKIVLPPLHLLAGASDEVFCRQLNISLGEYSEFKEEAVPRLKFNSQFDRWLKTGRPIDVIAL